MLYGLLALPLCAVRGADVPRAALGEVDVWVCPVTVSGWKRAAAADRWETAILECRGQRVELPGWVTYKDAEGRLAYRAPLQSYDHLERGRVVRQPLGFPRVDVPEVPKEGEAAENAEAAKDKQEKSAQDKFVDKFVGDPARLYPSLYWYAGTAPRVRGCTVTGYGPELGVRGKTICSSDAVGGPCEFVLSDCYKKSLGPRAYGEDALLPGETPFDPKEAEAVVAKLEVPAAKRLNLLFISATSEHSGDKLYCGHRPKAVDSEPDSRLSMKWSVLMLAAGRAYDSVQCHVVGTAEDGQKVRRCKLTVTREQVEGDGASSFESSQEGCSISAKTPLPKMSVGELVDEVVRAQEELEDCRGAACAGLRGRLVALIQGTRGLSPLPP